MRVHSQFAHVVPAGYFGKFGKLWHCGQFSSQAPGESYADGVLQTYHLVVKHPRKDLGAVLVVFEKDGREEQRVRPEGRCGCDESADLL